MNIMKETLKQDQKVKFHLGNLNGTGKVVGISTNLLTGNMYIIEPDNTIASEEYPYSHFVLPESYLECIK